ncbi:small oligopeptide transporter [Collybia nuda]|uniref:Small oligopeptide transporter n=1 Tax=Collybia nuda TaxID=64659 RepID=A0A9P6CHP1_9AGAR|nr:small oligopeptide transporter [Collybia nuda]
MSDIRNGEEAHSDTVYLSYDLRDEEKSLGSQAPSDSKLASSIRSIHGSDIYDVFDPNIDSDSVVLEDDSPYPEVRSAVANFDDPEMPASTLRAWVLGLFWAIIIPGMNQFFYFRYPSVAIGGLVAQLLVFPLGRAWARFVPCIKVLGVEVNPGPFSIKEHVLVTIMAGVGAQSAYATDIIAVQKVYYNQAYGFSYQWMLVMSTQLIGFSIGGIARRFLVTPPSMIWPNTLVSCALFNTLHSQSYAGIGQHEGLSREKFFLHAFIGAILWYFVPGYLFQALSVFNWVCWLAPNNIKINQIFGYRSGLGFSLLTFDWNQIAFIGSPLATPWWAEANVMIGFLVFYWFLTPVLYYKNVWFSHYMPISSPNAYDNTGKVYDQMRIIDNDAILKKEAYENYSPLYLSTTFAMSYGLSFLSITADAYLAAIIHFWKPIKLQFKRSLREQPDIHAQLMARYPQVPEWYYGCIFAITFTFACICIQLWPSGMTIWALVIALVISVLYIIPIGMIQAVTNRQIGLNVITELIIGFMIPGMLHSIYGIKRDFLHTYGYITMSQAMQFTADFKLGQPAERFFKPTVPPRPMFWCQVVATIIAGTVQLGVQSWMFTNIPDLCDVNQVNSFTCTSTQVFGTASIIWGLIGPGLLFSKNQIYYSLSFFFLIGAACPVILWLITRRYPNTILNYLKLIFAGVGQIPPATAVNYVPWAIIGFLFQFVVRRKHFSYWAKYNYVLSAALDAGTAVGLILVFFCLQYPLNGTIGKSNVRVWWGNDVYKRTLDWSYVPLKTLGLGETFGCVDSQMTQSRTLICFPVQAFLPRRTHI